MFFQLIRNFHSTLKCKAAETSLLATLRRKTGYTMANCKKALVMHENDVDKAEKWLHEQAQAMGWEKAAKLANRKALQGLIGVKYDNNHATMVEINCETDFVARNDKFHKMLEDATLACYKLSQSKIKSSGPITKMELGSEQLGNLTTDDGKKLSEKLALFIGSVGENAILRRAVCWKTNTKDVKLSAYTHPSPIAPAEYYSGKYGAVIAYKQPNDVEDIGKNMCLQVLGCAPLTIGEKRDLEEAKKTEEDQPADADTANEGELPYSDDKEETGLINQDYLLDPTITVQEFLEDHQAEVVDFTRMVCGEIDEREKQVEEGLQGAKQPLDEVQTLQ